MIHGQSVDVFPLGEDIDVHVNRDRGEVSLECGEVAFERLRKLIEADCGLDELIGNRIKDIRQIEIRNVSSKQRPMQSRHPLISLARGIVVMAALFLLVLWVVAIADRAR